MYSAEVNSLIILRLYYCQFAKLPIIYWEVILVKFANIQGSLLMLACQLKKISV